MAPTLKAAKERPSCPRTRARTADGWPLATAVHFPDADAPLPAQHVKGFYLEARCKHKGRCVPLPQRVAEPLPLSLPLRPVLTATARRADGVHEAYRPPLDAVLEFVL